MATAALVTGATGTVGRHVVAGLADTSVRVRAAARDPADLADAPADETVPFDFTHPETYYPALEGIDAVFLVRPPALGRVERDVNPFLDAAERMGVDHVVVLSVLGAQRNPLLPHRRIEKHVLGLDLDYTFLRASFFMQNLLGVHREDVVEHDELFVPAGDGETSFVDARDVAAVGVAALTDDAHRNAAIDVTGAEALTYGEVASVFTEVLDRPITYADPSILGFARRMLGRGHAPSYVLVMLGIYTTARLGLAGRVTDDVRRVLDRPPRTMRDFVADHAEDFAPA